RQPSEHRPDVAVAARLERRERRAPALGQGEEALPRIGGRGFLPDQLELLEAAQDPAEIAGIEPELARDFGRGRARARFELVKNARLGERERAVEPGRLQHADALGIETVEAAHGCDTFGDALLRNRLYQHGSIMDR